MPSTLVNRLPRPSTLVNRLPRPWSRAVWQLPETRRPRGLNQPHTAAELLFFHSSKSGDEQISLKERIAPSRMCAACSWPRRASCDPAEEERAFALRKDPLRFEMFIRDSKEGGRGWLSVPA